MKNSTFKIVLTLLFFMITYAGFSQPPMHANKRMETLKKMKLIEVLDMEEDQTNALLAKYDSWSDKIEDNRIKLDEIQKELSDALKNNDNKIKEISLKFEKQINDIHVIMKNRLEDFRIFLSSENYAKFLIFEKEFPRRIQKELMQRNRRKMNR